MQLNPGFNRVCSFSVFAQIHALELGERFDAKAVEVVERIEDEEGPGGSPKGNADASSNVDTKEIPRL